VLFSPSRCRNNIKKLRKCEKKDENKLKFVKKKKTLEIEKKVLEIKNKIVSLQQNMAKH